MIARNLTAVLLIALLVGCDGTQPEPTPEGVSGAYIGTIPAAGQLALDTSTASASLHVTVEESGFAHGLWILRGDTTTPTDPWEAVATGVYMGPRMVLEYSHPAKGSCQLNGPVSEASKFEPVRRCADAWDEPDTLDLDFYHRRAAFEGRQRVHAVLVPAQAQGRLRHRHRTHGGEA